MKFNFFWVTLVVALITTEGQAAEMHGVTTTLCDKSGLHCLSIQSEKSYQSLGAQVFTFQHAQIRGVVNLDNVFAKLDLKNQKVVFFQRRSGLRPLETQIDLSQFVAKEYVVN